MARYRLTWVDCRLPSGRDFSVAVCGYSGKVCYMTLGTDMSTRLMICQAFIEQGQCDRAEHCLAFYCPLNRTERIHAMHMLEMFQDENAGEETAKLWGTESVLEGLLQLSQKMNDILPEEYRKRQEPEIE